MYTLYKNSKRIGVFQTPNQLADERHLDRETVFRMICGETVNEMRVGKAKFATLAEPMTHEEISRRLGVRHQSVRRTFSKAIKKLNEKGILHEMLSMIRDLREIEEKHRGTYEIEMTTRITISGE